MEESIIRSPISSASATLRSLSDVARQFSSEMHVCRLCIIASSIYSRCRSYWPGSSQVRHLAVTWTKS